MPKLKHPLLCRATFYVVLIGSFLLPVGFLCALDFVPEDIKVLAFLGSLLLCALFMIKNFVIFMTLDTLLAFSHCLNTARKSFPIPPARTEAAIKRSLGRHGKSYEPLPLHPKPELLHYRVQMSHERYSRGIETVAMAFSVDLLDKETLRAIASSAKANTKTLSGTRRPLLTDPSQKHAPLHTATVAVIFSREVDASLRKDLLLELRKYNTDQIDRATILCVMDQARGLCIFDSVRTPRIGFGTSAQNRACHFIKKRVFGGRLPLWGNPDRLPLPPDLDPELSLWRFLHDQITHLVLEERKLHKQFAALKTGQILRDENYLHCKQGEQVVTLQAEFDDDTMTMTLDPIVNWSYPKVRQVSKADKQAIRKHLTAYAAGEGYRAVFSEGSAAKK